MDIEIQNPQTGQTHTIEWSGETPPTPEDIDYINHQIGQTKSSLVENAMSDIGGIIKGAIPATGQAVSTAGKLIIDLLTGSTIRNAMGQGEYKNPAVKAITEPSIKNIAQEIEKQSESEAPKYTPENIGKTLYEHPLQNQLVNVAGLVSPMFIKGGSELSEIKAPAKQAEAVVPHSTLETSKVMADRLGVQHSTIEALADPEMRKYMTPDLPTKTEAIEGEIHKSLQELPKGLSKAENKMYENAGVTDKTQTIWNKPVVGDLLEDGTRAEPITPIESMRNAIKDFEDMATSDEKPIASKANEFVNKIIKDSTFDKDGNMILDFGKSKSYSKRLWELSQDETLPSVARKLYGQMYQSAKVAKNSIPQVAEASKNFRDIENARQILKDTFRGFGDENKAFRAEKNIFSRYKDEGNVGFKQNIDKVGDILSNHPETAELSDFVKRVKIMNMAVDFAKAKAPKSGTLGTIVEKVTPKPATIMTGLANRINKGKFDVSTLLGNFPENKGAFTGRLMNTYAAFKPSILSLIRGGK